MYEPEIEYLCDKCGYEDYPGEDIPECPDCGNEDIDRVEHERESSFDWDDLIGNLQCDIEVSFKSFECSTGFVEYPYRENRIILENDHCMISISEYCGCGAISVFDNRNSEYPELAESWTNKNFEKIEKICEQYVTSLRRLGTPSNGCGVFEKKI